MPNFAQGYAFVVGIAHYPYVHPLPAIVLKDAGDVAGLLQRPERAGYLPEHVRLVLDQNATKRAILDGLSWLAQSATGDATAIFYFSGHGGRFDSGPAAGNYLIPFDTQIDTIRDTAVSSDELTQALRAIQAERMVVLLDACHSGGTGDTKDIGPSVKDLDPNAPVLKGGLDQRLYDTLTQGAGRVIFASSRSSETSLVLPGATNSLFTQVLLEALNGQADHQDDGLLRILDIVKYVLQNVPARCNQQNPIFKATDVDKNFPIALYLGGQKTIDSGSATQPAPGGEQRMPSLIDLRNFIDTRMNRDDVESLCAEVEVAMQKAGRNYPREPFSIDVVKDGSRAIVIQRLLTWLQMRNRLDFMISALRDHFPGEL
jgi:Caspase domain